MPGKHKKHSNPSLASGQRTAAERALHTAICARAICTRDNGELPRKTSHGRHLNWLLDIRRLFLNGEDLELVTEVFWEYMEEKLPFQIGGLESGAVPLISALLVKATQRGHNVNGFFVRKSRKKSGLNRQVEGELNSDPIVIVDDLMNTGGSLRRSVTALRDEGHQVRDFFVFANFENPDALEYLEENRIHLSCPFTISDLGLTKTKEGGPYPKQETLEIEWMFSPPDPNYIFVIPMSTPVLDENRIYYGGDNGVFYGIDQRSGEKAWKFQTGESLKGILSSPQLYGNGVIFGAYDGTVYNLNRDTGDIIWRYDAADSVGSSPSVSASLGLVFIGLEQNVFNNKGSVAALDADSGERVWEHTLREYLHGTPVYSHQKELVAVGTNDKSVLCLDAASGELRWEFKMEGELKAGVTFDLKRNQVIAPSFDWNCYAIDIDTGEGKILFTGNHAFYNTALVVENRLYVGSCGKRMYIYDLSINKLLTSFKTMGRIMSHPAFIDGHVFFGCNDGCIREIDLDGNIVGGIYLPERSLTQLQFNSETGLFYMVTAGNHLVALRRKDSQFGEPGIST